MTSHLSVAVSGIAAAALLVGGCSKPNGCTVTGAVLYRDKPAEGVYVVFSPTDIDVDAAVASVSARTGSDGAFRVEAPAAGQYGLTAFWPSVVLDEGAVVEGPDRFGGRYRDPRRPITTADVHEGENQLAPILLEPR